MKHILNGVMLLFFVISSTKKLDHNGLFEDLKKYKKERGECHAGHLYEHMLWVAKSMGGLYDTQSPWVAHLAHDRELMITAAFMHDIGKAGDLQYLYLLKPKHPQTGVDYFLKKQSYKLNAEGDTYDFDAWVAQVGLTQEQVKTLIVLIGMHQEFGLLLKNLRLGQSIITLCNNFMEKLRHFVVQADYNNGIPDEKIIRMCCALSRADLEGMFPVDNQMTDFPDLPDHEQTLQAKPIGSVVLVDALGPIIVEFLVQHAHTKVYAYGNIKNQRIGVTV